MYELIIVGGGPAGVAAGVYAARKKIKSALITDGFGGQSLVSADIQNWIGTKSVSGFDFSKMLEEHLRAQEGIEIFYPDLVERIDPVRGGGSLRALAASNGVDHFRVVAKSGKALETKTVLVTTGSRRRKLNVPGEKEFDGKGVAYCSTCDAPVFKGKATAVVGGGNAGLEAVRDLLSYATHIYLLHRGPALKGDLIIQEQIQKSSKVEVVLNANTVEILGDKFVTGLRYEDADTKKKKELKVDGVFVEIGSVPNVEFLGDLVEKNQFGEIIVDHKTQQASQPGIWAAGDVSDVLYKQNNISAGDAVKAVLNIYGYLNRNN